MFTGIIEQVGKVREVAPSSAGFRLVVDPLGWTYRARTGDSVAVNGCCLTVAADPHSIGGLLAFDVIPETLRKTTLGEMTPGHDVHLEHAATPTTLLGGHVVQGHIDGVGEVLHVTHGQATHQQPSEWRMRIRLPAELASYLVPKGSIAMNGVSLTIANIVAGGFEVALIPTTLAKTTLGALVVGSRVNIECDAMAKTIIEYLRHMNVTRHSPA